MTDAEREALVLTTMRAMRFPPFSVGSISAYTEREAGQHLGINATRAALRRLKDRREVRQVRGAYGRVDWLLTDDR